jgi:hypothetical protein
MMLNTRVPAAAGKQASRNAVMRANVSVARGHGDSSRSGWASSSPSRGIAARALAEQMDEVDPVTGLIIPKLAVVNPVAG